MNPDTYPSHAGPTPTGTSSTSAPVVGPITAADIQAVAEYMCRGMSSARSAAEWQHAMTPPWAVEQPNHGYLMRENGHVVGAYLASYSERSIDGRTHRICNLGAWCVDEQHRAAGLRMLRKLLRQRGYTFTDLTANPDVVRLNTRLGFVALDTTTVLVPNVFWPLPPKGVRVIENHREIDGTLTGRDRAIYRDHVATAAHQVVLTSGRHHCLVVFRRDSYKRLPLFATVLHVSSPQVFQECSAAFYRHLLVRKGIAATLVELRVVGHRPRTSVHVGGRPKMYISDELSADQIDYLYSELTGLA